MSNFWRMNQVKQDFVGLSNQGATCYMNSLLQTLYMSFDFRNQIYKWQFDPQKHGNSQDSIPYQLQVLFGKLQLSDSQYIQTTDLTKSFGWDPHQGFQQHDVQEFCRVLFDAIEQSVQGTAQADMIKSLYQGSYLDEVKCMKCSRGGSREDKFLDLSLTVKNPFDKVYNDSIEKALRNYLKPEELTGDNQYSCDVCESKQDALKGLKFKELPYILVLQLKRFDLDYDTFQRIKLNDKVTFPQILNMNPFVRDIPQVTVIAQTNKSDSDHSEQILDQLQFNTSQLVMQYKNFSYFQQIAQDQQKKPIKLDPIAKKKQIEMRAQIKKQQRAKLIDTYRQDGPDVYQLYSVMIHSGSAMGGHYYAYIKSFETERWYNFNDETVKEIDDKDLQKVFGGQARTSYWGSSYSTNAYLLMYRRVDQAENINFIQKSEVPPNVLEELEKERQREIQAELEKAQKLKYMKLRIYYNKKEKVVEAKRSSTVGELKQKVMEVFQMTDIAAENLRLRGYSIYYDILQETFKQSKTLDSTGLHPGRILSIQTKESHQEFQEYDPFKVTVKVHVWNDQLAEGKRAYQRLLGHPTRISVDKRSTIKKLMEIFQQKFGIQFNNQKVLRKAFMQNQIPDVISTVVSREQPISYSRIIEGTELYLQTMEKQSRWQQFFLRQASKYTIKFNHPDSKVDLYGHYQTNDSVMLDSKKSLEKLKQKISEKIQIPVDEFIMKKGSKYGNQLKDLTMSLRFANLNNNSLLYIERGKQSKPDQIRLGFYLALKPTEDECDGNLFSFQQLVELSVNTNNKFIDIKTEICQHLNRTKPELQAQVKRIRLRQKHHQKLGRVLGNNDTIKFAHFFDKKKIGVQILEEDEKQMEYAEILMAVRRWYPSTWELEETKQIYINKHWKIFEFGEKLSEIYGIPLERLHVFKVSYTYNFMRGELASQKFTRTQNNYHYLSGNPWYLNQDGNLFIVRDKDEEMRAMTSEEKRKYGQKVGSIGGWKFQSPKEKSVKIRVKKKEETKEKEEEDSSVVQDWQ